MPGIQDFTYLNYGKETVRGTPVAPTRKFTGEATGVLGEDRGWNLHEGENRGRRSEVGRAPSQQTEDASLRMASVDGIGFDDMVLPLTQLKGGMTGVGGGADKTWTGAPSMVAANNPEAFTFDAGDDVQNWRYQYAMMTDWELSAGRGDLTQLVANLFAQRALKVAKATPADTAPVKIAGDWWTLKLAATFAGLPGASVQLNLLLSWKLKVRTGLVWRHYQDGNFFGSQHVETSIGGDLSLEVESTAASVTEFYDKWAAGTVGYARLRAQGPVLGGSFYSLQFDLPLVYTEVKPIDKEEQGINVYSVTARLLDDGTNPPISPILVGSLAAIP